MTAQAQALALRRQGDLNVLCWPAFDAFTDVDMLVTTRHGGVSAGSYGSLNLGMHVGDAPEKVVENRRRAAAAIGADLEQMVFCQQTHGRTVAVVTHSDGGRGALSESDALPETDALVTATPGVGLAIMAADCVPIVLYDPVARVLGCVHSGWRGTVARVSAAALEAMASLGARPENVVAGIGPAISPGAYQVGAEVKDHAERAFGTSSADLLRPDGADRWLFDLWAANRLVLAEAGIPASAIHLAGVPTGPDPGLFFSYREAARCGRFAVLARLRP